jgi:hypothetical protein
MSHSSTARKSAPSSATIERYVLAGFGDHLLPIIPHDAKLSWGSKVSPKSRGKVPGRYKAQQDQWTGYKGWTIAQIDDVRREEFATYPTPNWGLRGEECPGVDIDSTRAVLAKDIEHAALRILGPAPARGRANSARRLLVYRADQGALVYRGFQWKMPGSEELHAVEILGRGKQYLVEGIHPSGKPYAWRDGKDLPAVGKAALTPITAEKVEEFRAAVKALIAEHGGTVLAVSTGGSGGDQREIGDPWLFADSPEEAVEALNCIPCEDLDYHQWVAVLRAFKAAVGGAEDHYSDAEEWSAEYAQNTDETTRGKWDSFKTSSIGGDWLYGFAREYGFTGGGSEFEGYANDNVPDWVAEMNAKHMIVNEAGKTVVYTPRRDEVLKRDVLERSSFKDFVQLYLGDVTGDASGKKVQSKGEAWVRHRARRIYRNGVAFLPCKEAPEGVYNLWRGFTVEAAPGSWAKLQAHMRDNICNGDDAAYDYLTRWLAYCVQNPGEPGHVAVVMRGGKGVGKGILARLFGQLWGQHFVHVSTAKHLVGNFNLHLRDAVVVFADEAFFAGDKQHEGTLKALVTEPTIMIEGKGANVVQVRNCIHLMLASNEDWVVPASGDERRYLVVDVAPHRQQDAAYFKAITDEMKGGGSAAMLHDLKQMDLSGFNIRKVPQTVGLTDQKLQSLKDVERWWLDALTAGEIAGISDFDHIEDGPAWPSDPVLRKSVYNHYVAHARRGNVYRPMTLNQFGEKLHGLVPGLQSPRPRNDDGKQGPRCYAFPPLAECRTAFERIIGAQLPWEQ